MLIKYRSLLNFPASLQNWFTGEMLMGCRANFCLGEVNIFLVLYNTLLPHKLLIKALQSVKYANPQCLCLTRHPKRANGSQICIGHERSPEKHCYQWLMLFLDNQSVDDNSGLHTGLWKASYLNGIQFFSGLLTTRQSDQGHSKERGLIFFLSGVKLR